MNKEFVMRGQTASGGTEVLNFSGYKPGYAYRLVEFQIFPSNNIGGQAFELMGTITAGKTAVAPTDPDFSNEGLIGSNLTATSTSQPAVAEYEIVNDTFLITQNLILMVQEANSSALCNWQCRFEAVLMTDSQAAVTNFKQFLISDGS